MYEEPNTHKVALLLANVTYRLISAVAGQVSLLETAVADWGLLAIGGHMSDFFTLVEKDE